MGSPTVDAAPTSKRITPPTSEMRTLFASSRPQSPFAIDWIRCLVVISRARSLFAINGIRSLFGSLGSGGFRVSKSGINFSSICTWVALRGHIGAQMDEPAMNQANQPRVTPPPMRLPISESPCSPFHLVETIVDARCYPGVNRRALSHGQN
jgi:hypothetical protein